MPANTSWSPPGTAETVHAGSVLVLAPHYDDEVLGCGGLLAQLVASGAAVRVLFFSDGGGAADSEERSAYVERRRREARAAAEALGLAGIDEMLLPDGALELHLEEMTAGIRRAILSQRPELLLVTSPLEVSADHRAAFRALHLLLGACREGGELSPVVEGLRVLAYEVNQPAYPDLLVDVSAEVPAIEAAMACYASQRERHDYLGARLGLLRFRTLSLPPEVGSAEAYRRLGLEDFTTHSPSGLVRALGGSPELEPVEQGPLVSVIVRTFERPELLSEALASLARGIYRRAQVIVVNDGGEPPELPETYPLGLERIDLESNRGRAAAANAGLAAAEGEYVAFLDDDDLAEGEHLATLTALARSTGARVVYTDAAVGIYRLGEDGRWRREERRLPYSRDFDPDLLLFDNYIPFHTLLIERSLLAEVGPLDEELAFFEDWDLLLRLAERAPFHHLPRVTCEYRQFRGSGRHVLGERPREREDFLSTKARVLAKHAERRGAEATARVVDLLRSEAVVAREEASRRREELEAMEARVHRARGKAAGLEIHSRSLESDVANLRRELEEHRRALARHGVEIEERDSRLRELYANSERQEEQLRATYAEIERLGSLIREMEGTRAWRLHQRLTRRKP